MKAPKQSGVKQDKAYFIDSRLPQTKEQLEPLLQSWNDLQALSASQVNKQISSKDNKVLFFGGHGGGEN